MNSDAVAYQLLKNYAQETLHNQNERQIQHWEVIRDLSLKIYKNSHHFPSEPFRREYTAKLRAEIKQLQADSEEDEEEEEELIEKKLRLEADLEIFKDKEYFESHMGKQNDSKLNEKK